MPALRRPVRHTAAGQLGDEAGYPEIVAWSHEMGAWFALTQSGRRSEPGYAAQ
jgi:hypothetical protein